MDWFNRAGSFEGVGADCAAFEATLAAHYGVAHAVLVNSGTTALSLLLREAKATVAWSRCIIPAWAPVPVWNAVEVAGVVPIPVDVIEDGSYSPAALNRVAGSPDLLVYVHPLGSRNGRARTLEWCSRHGVTMIEDQAAAFGLARDVLGTAAILSFGSMKRLSCGQGGAVLCDRDDIADRVRWQIDQGQGYRDGQNLSPGNNLRLDDARARMLIERMPAALEGVDETLRRQNHINRFASRAGIAPALFNTIRVPDAFAARDLLAAQGVPSRVQYPPIDRHPAYAGWTQGATYPGAAALYGGLLFLPFGPDLTMMDASVVAQAVGGLG